MNITTTIPEYFWITIANAVWWSLMLAVLFRGLSWFFQAYARFTLAEAKSFAAEQRLTRAT